MFILAVIVAAAVSAVVLAVIWDFIFNGLVAAFWWGVKEIKRWMTF